MLAKVAGDSRFKVGEGDKTWNELEFVQPDSIQLGGGLATDAQGKIYVDFSQMPTDKFEALLKSIYIPILLTKNTNFYVATTGSDVLDTGRGLSADKPFKTIQACIDYICDNYNLSKYNATINIADGIYAHTTKHLEIKSFQASGGSLILQGQSRDTTVLDFNPSYIFSINSNNTVTLRNIAVIKTVNYETFKPTYLIYLGLFSITSGAASIENCKFSLTEVENSSDPNSNVSGSALIAASYGQTQLIFRSHGSSLILNIPKLRKKVNMSFISGAYYTKITVTYGSNQENAIMQCEGTAFAFISLSSGATYERYSTGVPFVFTGDVTGKRYVISTAAQCNTRYAGTNYFPGTEAGIVNTDQFAMYI